MIKIVILDQSKPISLYLKIKKSKIQKFINYTFIIHKNGNNTGIQPILKLNYTSFMFNTIFCKMRWRVKKLSTDHWGGPGGNGGAVLISSWKCNFSIYLDIQVYYLDIQVITTLLCLILFIMCCFLLFIQFSMLQPLFWKVTCSSTQKPKAPRILDLQGWD